jgi:hypothetical protein
LAYGLLGFGQRSLSPELDVVEAYTWAHTCEDTIRIFVEKGLPLTDNNRMYYQAWVSAGRHADSEQWQQFIHGDHALARKQP